MHKWDQHQVAGYAGNHSTASSLDTDRMRFAREKLGSPPKTIVDFGCSDGSFTLELARKGFDVTGVDLPEVLKSFHLEIFDKGIDPRVRSTGLNLDEPFQLKGFDVGLCLEILEHLLRDFDFLLNVRRLLNVGGYIVLSTPRDNTIQEGDHHLRYYPENSLRKLLDSAGYERIEISAGENSLLAVAYK